MSGYDFRSLSSQDLEELVRDLLQKEWQLTLESFKPGKDSGIDLRHATVSGQSIIVQCKHFVKSGYSLLHSHLKINELPKVQTLTPSRYVLVTSVGLTPKNKREIEKLFSPYIKSTSDIYGQDDLNNLLGKFPEIEKQHHKLWLTSTAVLERVLKNAAVTQTNFKIERILQKLPVFVETKSFPAAVEILDRNHVVVISGNPGIGKTTLAEMMLYVYLEQGFVPIQVTENIKEAFDFYAPDQNQIFYYDDFLGQTLLHDRFGKNEDASIVDFMKLAIANKNIRFILTTREYIFNHALMHSERLANSGLDSTKYVLNLTDYSRVDKARILYNHLYFSDLPTAFIEEILRDKFYFHIIDHPNFSPRIVEWMSSLNQVNKIPVDDYREFFSQTLDFPSKLWKHAFDHQIESYSRVLLMTLYSLAAKAKIEDLRKAFESLQERYVSRYKISTSPKDFQFGLKELEGAFTTTGDGSVEFHNPAVKDFLETEFSEEPSFVDDLLNTAVLFKQVETMWLLYRRPLDKSEEKFRVSVEKESLFSAFAKTCKAKAYLVETTGGTRIYRKLDTGLMGRALVLINVFEYFGDQRFLDLATQVVIHISELVYTNDDDINIWFDYGGLHKLIDALVTSTSIKEPEREYLLKSLEPIFRLGVDKANEAEDLSTLDQTITLVPDLWDRNAWDYMKERVYDYIDNDCLNELDSLDESTQLQGVAETLDRLGLKYDVDTRYEVSRAEDIAQEILGIEEQKADSQMDIWRDERYEQRSAGQEEAQVINDLFENLSSYGKQE